jgi:hypothetical protein
VDGSAGVKKLKGGAKIIKTTNLMGKIYLSKD